MGLFSKKPTPKEFYANCVKQTHDLAIKHGFVKGGVKLIPELLPYCQRLINSDLNCEEVTSRYKDNATLLQAMCDRCQMYGIILADTWHRDFSHLEDKVDDIELEGLDGYIQPLVEGVLGFPPKLFTQWLEAISVTCFVEFGKINSSDKQYSYMMMAACYQLGISIMLSHYGL